MKSKPTVAIGIPAYNEEQNIGILLDTLLNQKLSDTRISNILVYSDASTDSTNKIVKNYARQYKKIELIVNRKRIGKFGILNKLFKKNNSDYLLILDADIGIKQSNFIEIMLKPFEDEKVVMVSSDQVPLPSKTLIGKIIRQSFLNWRSVRLDIKNRNNNLNFEGAATAYRKDFTKKLHIPNDVYEERLFLYLMATKFGKYIYNGDARIYVWTPSTLHDVKKMAHRPYGDDSEYIQSHFSISVHELIRVSVKNKIVGMTKEFLRSPLLSTLAVMINIYLGSLRSKAEIKHSQIWETLDSTKSIISLGKVYNEK